MQTRVFGRIIVHPSYFKHELGGHERKAVYLAFDVDSAD